MQNKNRGAAMVEFALVAPFFFMLIACIIYGGCEANDAANQPLPERKRLAEFL